MIYFDRFLNKTEHRVSNFYNQTIMRVSPALAFSFIVALAPIVRAQDPAATPVPRPVRPAPPAEHSSSDIARPSQFSREPNTRVYANPANVQAFRPAPQSGAQRTVFNSPGFRLNNPTQTPRIADRTAIPPRFGGVTPRAGDRNGDHQNWRTHNPNWNPTPGTPTAIPTVNRQHWTHNRDWQNRDGQNQDWRNRDPRRTNNWQGANNYGGTYQDASRRYHHEHHNRDWWRSHCNRIILVSGGYYYWDTGYWYPAWGYDRYYSDYAYDGPIYGYDGLPPDQVIANVQSALQQEGYYPYAVDGVLGPVTRQAIAAYQRDHGLAITTAVDYATLRSLGLA